MKMRIALALAALGAVAVAAPALADCRDEIARIQRSNVALSGQVGAHFNAAIEADRRGNERQCMMEVQSVWQLGGMPNQAPSADGRRYDDRRYSDRSDSRYDDRYSGSSRAPAYDPRSGTDRPRDSGVGGVIDQLLNSGRR
jgi:hypothetical protein